MYSNDIMRDVTLTTHAIVGTAAMTATVAALGATLTGLTLGVAAGFASHFVIDAIPHWNEGSAILRSTTRNKHEPLEGNVIAGEYALRDFSVVSADGLLGLFLSIVIFSVWLFHVPVSTVFLGAAAGECPDALQFFYFKTRLKLMEPLQKFHHRIQIELAGVLYLSIELGLVIIIVGALKLFI